MHIRSPLTLSEAISLLIEMLTRMLAEWIAARESGAAVEGCGPATDRHAGAGGDAPVAVVDRVAGAQGPWRATAGRGVAASARDCPTRDAADRAAAAFRRAVTGKFAEGEGADRGFGDGAACAAVRAAAALRRLEWRCRNCGV